MGGMELSASASASVRAAEDRRTKRFKGEAANCYCVVAEGVHRFIYFLLLLSQSYLSATMPSFISVPDNEDKSFSGPRLFGIFIG